METRAYLSADDEATFRVTVYPEASLYSRGEPAEGQSWSFPLIKNDADYVMGAQPEQPYEDADAVLSEHGWTREGRWVSGDVFTGTYVRVSRTKHVVQGTDPIKARHLREGE